MKIRCLLIDAPDQIRLGTANIPEPGPGEVRLRARYTLISPGTELRVFHAKQPDLAPFPFIPGYTFAGTVDAVGEGVSLSPGQRVFARGTEKVDVERSWGGHVEFAIQRQEMVVPIPDSVSDLDAGLARLGGIALRGVRMAEPRPAEPVVVVGLGPIGQLSARLFHAMGATVIGIDRVPGRVELLRRAGIEGRVLEGSVRATIADRYPNGVGIVADSTGSTAALAGSVAALMDIPWQDRDARENRLIIQGSYPDLMPLHYQEIFLKEAGVFFPRDMQPRDAVAVMSLLGSGRVSTEGLVSRTYRPEEAAEAYATLDDPASGLCTAAFDWQ